MKKPKLSLITVCFNAGDTIEKTLSSVANQTYENIEYIIVDGASTDNTLEIINKFQSDITAFVSEKDKGIYDAYNKGLQLATGDFIQYLNANDHLVDETAIERVVEQIVTKNYPDVVYGAVYHCNPVTGFLRRYNEQISNTEIPNGKMLPFPATFIKREVLKEVGGFSLNYPILADYELISRIAKADYSIEHMDDVYVSVFYEGGISTQFSNFNIIENERETIIQNHFGQAYNKKIIPNENYYKKWITSVVYQNKGIANQLLERSINQVAIFGCGETSSLIASDCAKHNITVHAFIDNDIKKQDILINGVNVESSQWLLEHNYKLDAIVLGFEGYHEQAVIEQINDLLGSEHNVKLVSWRELVSYLY